MRRVNSSANSPSSSRRPSFAELFPVVTLVLGLVASPILTWAVNVSYWIWGISWLITAVVVVWGFSVSDSPPWKAMLFTALGGLVAIWIFGGTFGAEGTYSSRSSGQFSSAEERCIDALAGQNMSYLSNNSCRTVLGTGWCAAMDVAIEFRLEHGRGVEKLYPQYLRQC